MLWRIPPLDHDPQAERELLATALIRPSEPVLDELRRALPGICEVRHRLIGRAILEAAAAADGAVSAALVRAELEGSPTEEWGGPSYLGELMAEASVPAAAAALATRILRRAYRRQLRTRADTVARTAGNGVSDAELSALLAELAALEPPEHARDSSLADILSDPDVELPWLVEGLWTHPEVSILCGPGGVGKTWIGLHLAAALATGGLVFGRWPAAAPRRVGIVDLERGPGIVDRRLRMVARGVEMPPEAAERVHVLRRRVILDDVSDAGVLRSWVRQRGLEWVMIDSMAAGMTGDSIEERAIQLVFSRSLYPVRDLGCSVLLIDHVRKDRGDRHLDSPGQALSGNARKRNAADSLFGVRRRNADIEWLPDKANHHAEPEAGSLRLRVEEGAATVQWVGGLDLASDAAQDAVLELLRRNGGELHRGEIVGRLASSYQERTVSGALKALKLRRKVASQTVGRHAVYSLR